MEQCNKLPADDPTGFRPPPPATPARRMTTAMTVLFAAAVGVIVMNLYAAQPMLAAIRASMRIPDGAIGLIAMLPLLGYTCGQFLVVPLTDLHENRRLIVRLLAGCALCLGVAMLSTQAWLFLTAIFLAGVLSSAIQMLVPMAAFMSEEAHRGRVIGNLMSGLMLGIMLSRPLAGWIASIAGWRAVYGLLALIVATLALLLARVLPERHPQQTVQRYGAILRSLWQLLLHERTLQYSALTGGLGMAAYMSYWTTIALLLTQAPFSLGAGGIAVFALVGASAVCVTPFAGRAGDHGRGRIAARRSRLAVLAAALIAGVAGSGWGGFDVRGHAGVALALLGLAAILLDGGVAAEQTLERRKINLLSPQLRGRLNGLFVGFLFVGGAVGAALSGLAWNRGGWTAVCLLQLLFSATIPLLASRQLRN
ncbi:MFS transporter [Herbaspirillum sp. RV1423]|uniref:MFS transporter n=1 Tax=Herbaspirillum sp. RV1423 TaxID=1443993 RepID=UPI0004BC8FEA|nr:MFS transporter [Herbaspirillum sp. RV1423]